MSTIFDELPEGAIPNDVQKRCKICRYFCPYVYSYDNDGSEDHISTDYGECRRFPPTKSHLEEERFPIVDTKMWCGEFDI